MEKKCQDLQIFVGNKVLKEISSVAQERRWSFGLICCWKTGISGQGHCVYSTESYQGSVLTLADGKSLMKLKSSCIPNGN